MNCEKCDKIENLFKFREIILCKRCLNSTIENLIENTERSGNRCDMWYKCDECGVSEYGEDSEGESVYTEMFSYKNEDFCRWCLKNKFEEECAALAEK